MKRAAALLVMFLVALIYWPLLPHFFAEAIPAIDRYRLRRAAERGAARARASEG